MTGTQNVDATIAEMQAELDSLRQEVSSWRVRYEKGKVRDLNFTNSGHEVAPLYTALDLDGSKVCVQDNTTTKLNVADYFRANNMKYQEVKFTKPEDMREAYNTGK